MTESNSFADHFSSTAARYSQYRPGYPVELFDYLASLCCAHDCMWDCATGSGQAARQFVTRFKTVIASDASFEQARNAQQSAELFYLASLAEQTPFVDHCFDLITVAQALHWFDPDRFYAEVNRILKPGGVLAVWTYNLMQVNPAIDEIIWHLYSDVLGDYWAFERKLVEAGYADLAFPFTEHKAPQFAMQTDWTLQHLTGYLSTWSAVKRYREEHNIDPVSQLSTQLAAAWGEQQQRTVSWPLSIKVGTV